MVYHIIFFKSIINISRHIAIHIPLLYYDVTQWPRLSYPRVTVNRSDLTLQGRPNSHDTCKPRRTRVSCSHHYHDIWSTSAKTQVKGPSRWTPGEPGEDIQSKTRHHPTPSVAGRNSKYRSKAVHSLPISTTSYFRYVVSTVQSSINTANNGTVLNRHRRGHLRHQDHVLLPSLTSQHHSPSGLHFSFLIDSFSNNFAISNKIL